MLDALTDKLSDTMKSLRGMSRLTEENVDEALRNIRMALLEADVALPVARAFAAGLKEEALGERVIGSLTPGQALVGIAHERLRDLMGEREPLALAVAGPAAILMCGLQGTGKTTTCAKLAKRLRADKKKVLLASCDTQRPAAIKQLEILAASVGVDFYADTQGKTPEQIAQGAKDKARVGYYDVLILDTAGRTSIDEALMEELARVEEIAKPAECLLAIDAMMGQQALSVAEAFGSKVKLTGLVITKLDGDSRGGAMLSAKGATGLPIKLVGVSERMDGLEEFDPERMAGRVLGMGDILGLVEQAQAHHDEKMAAKLEAKFKSGESFDLDDFVGQIRQMRKMGGISTFVDKLPAEARKMAMQAPGAAGDKQLAQMEGIISSMTPKERAKPELLKGSRKQRVAKGAGVQVMHVNQLLKQYETVSTMMKSLQGGGMGRLMRLAGGGRAPGHGKGKSSKGKRRK
jgi:signal recognition particle subunit SRP54